LKKSFHVRVTKDHLVFSAGHFITFDGDHCERIHGHNYRVAVEVGGELDENHYVFDFIALLEITRALVLELDHRMLLPTQSTRIRLDHVGPNVIARYGERHWSFPKEECVLLPIPNTTTELLADYLSQKIADQIQARNLAPPAVMRVEVEENFGQSAVVEWRGLGS
jgi:6-pyruvoyltetrahydropterin/6-carboxytetrahydropterin synthase